MPKRTIRTPKIRFVSAKSATFRELLPMVERALIDKSKPKPKQYDFKRFKRRYV